MGWLTVWFWSVFFGRQVTMPARDARQPRAAADGAPAPRRQARLPIDYQTDAPDLVGVELGPRQVARVRVSFSQLAVVVAPGAAGQAAMASAQSLSLLAASFGGAMGACPRRRVLGLLGGSLRSRLDPAVRLPDRPGGGAGQPHLPDVRRGIPVRAGHPLFPLPRAAPGGMGKPAAQSGHPGREPLSAHIAGPGRSSRLKVNPAGKIRRGPLRERYSAAAGPYRPRRYSLE
jgi:hypothetical protein